MKLIKEHIGQKFTRKSFSPDEYFLLLAITSGGFLIGENQEGDPDHWNDDDHFIPYEPQPKQEVKEQRELLMSPSVMD